MSSQRASTVGSVPQSNTSSTDLVNSKQPDSSNLIIERYEKYIRLIQVLQSFAEHYLNIINANVRLRDKLNNYIKSENFPVFDLDKDSTVPVSGATATNTDGSMLDDTQLIGVNSFLESLRMRVESMYTASVDLESKFKAQIIPQFKTLEKQVFSRKKEFENTSTKELKDLRKIQLAGQKQVQSFEAAVTTFDHNYDTKLQYSHDPFLLKRAIANHASLQIQKENSHIDFLQSNEETLKIMESQIFEISKKIFNDMSALITNYYGQSINVFSELNNQLEAIPNGLEWQRFLDANGDRMVSTKSEGGSLESDLQSLSLKAPSASELIIPTYKPSKNSLKRDLKSIDFNHSDHQATLPILEGVLSRKEGTLSKKFVSYYYVITRSKYLLEFQSRNPESSFQPSLVLYLPECVPREATDKNAPFAFIINGKDSTGVLKSKKNYLFKANTEDEHLVWYNVINEVSGVMMRNAMSKYETEDDTMDSTVDTSATPTAPETPITATNIEATSSPIEKNPSLRTPERTAMIGTTNEVSVQSTPVASTRNSSYGNPLDTSPKVNNEVVGQRRSMQFASSTSSSTTGGYTDANETSNIWN